MENGDSVYFYLIYVCLLILVAKIYKKNGLTKRQPEFLLFHLHKKNRPYCADTNELTENHRQ